MRFLSVLLFLFPALALARAPAAETTADGVTLVATASTRRFSLTGGAQLASSYRPSENSALRLTDGLRFGHQETPPLDQGGGVNSDTRQVLALVLGLFVGFGLGHFIAKDKQGFLLFLIVDIVICGAIVVLWWGGGWPLHLLGWAGLFVSHVIQGLDAYGAAGGERLVDEERRRDTVLAARREGRDEAWVTPGRALGFSF